MKSWYSVVSMSIILCMVLSVSAISQSSPAEQEINLEPTMYGGGISSVDGFPYRVKIKQWDANIVLYPLNHYGKLNMQTGIINTNSSINIIVEVIFNVTSFSDGGRTTYLLGDILTNHTLEPHSYQQLNLTELDHHQMVSVYLDNGTAIPITSYAYFNQVNQNATISSTMNLYFEIANHSRAWSHEVDIIKMQGNITYFSDEVFYTYLKSDEGTEQDNNKLPLSISAIPLILILMVRQRKLLSS